MIERNDEILPALTDEALTAAVAGNGAYSPERAALLLTVPGTYRQGVEAYTNRLMYRRTKNRNGLLEDERTPVSEAEAWRQARAQLADQGVTVGRQP